MELVVSLLRCEHGYVPGLNHQKWRQPKCIKKQRVSNIVVYTSALFPPALHWLFGSILLAVKSRLQDFGDWLAMFFCLQHAF